MTSLLADPIERSAVAVPALRHFEGASLDEFLVRAWEGLVSSASTVACPVCGGAMAPRRATGGPGGELRVTGLCRACGSELS